MPANGSGSVSGVTDDLTTSVQDLNPRLSADGSTITFWSTRLGTPGAAVYTVSSNGGTLTNVTDYDSNWPTYVTSTYPAIAPTLNYVALGDSVVSGEGTYYGWHWDGSAWQRSTTTDPTWEDSSIAGQHCHLSKNGYPYLVAFNKNLNLTDLGCTGARAVLGVLSAQDFGGGVVADYPQLGDPDLYGPADPNYDDGGMT